MVARRHRRPVSALALSLGLTVACTAKTDNQHTEAADQTTSSTPPPPPDDGSAVVPVPVALLAGAFLTQVQVALGSDASQTPGAVQGRAGKGTVEVGTDAAAFSLYGNVLMPRLARLRTLQDDLFSPTGPFKGKALTVTAGQTTLYKVDGASSVWTGKHPAVVALSMDAKNATYPVSVDVRCARAASDQLELCLHYGLKILSPDRALVQLRFFDEDQTPTPLFVFDLVYDTSSVRIEGQFGEEPPTTLDADRYAFQVDADAATHHVNLRSSQYYDPDSAGDWQLPYLPLPYAGDILLTRYRLDPADKLGVMDQAWLSGDDAAKVGNTVTPDVFKSHGLMEFLEHQAMVYLRGPKATPPCATLGDQLAAQAAGMTTPARLPANVCAANTAVTDEMVLTYLMGFCTAHHDLQVSGSSLCTMLVGLLSGGSDRLTIDNAALKVEPGATSSAAAQLATEMEAAPYPLRVGYWRTQALPKPDSQPQSAFAGAQAPP